MARQIIDNGSFDNDPGAEKIRLAFGKVNDMTEELYSYLNGTGKAAERIVQHIESGESELVEVANSVNATSSLVVPRNTLQIVTFIEPYGSGSETVSYLKKRQYILKRGQGTYGAASLNTVLPTDFIILTPVIIGINDATTFDLGDIEGADISDYVNTSGPYLIVGTTIFETTEGSYVFSGDDGLYGLGEIQTEDENFIPFNSVPSGVWEKIHNLSLAGIDTSGDELTYIAEAVNEFGAFTCDTDEQMIFRTQTPYEDGVIERYYALIPRVTTIGGGATITIPSSYFRPDGQSITGEIPSNILIELGDIGTTDIEDAFNVGDGGDPWDMSVKRFIRATYDGDVALWSWQGEDGEFGGSGTPATADDFFLITGQPSPPYSLFKQYATTTAMIADQANQITKQVYRVLNASDDPNITFPMGETKVYAYYEKKLAVTTGNISDYYLISVPYGNHIPEAPEDGNTYGRLDGEWESIFKQTIQTGNFVLTVTDNHSIISSDGGSCTIHPNTQAYQDAFECELKNITESTNGSIIFSAASGWTYKLNDDATVSSGTIPFPAGAICKIIKFEGEDKFYVNILGAGSGTTIPVSKTGTTIVFTENALYNEIAYLTSGNLTLDLTGAVKGTTQTVYCLEYIPIISGEDFMYGAGYPSSSALNIYTMFYDGTNIVINTIAVEPLDAPLIEIDVLDTELAIDWGVAFNADNYILERDTDSGFGTAIEVYNGSNTDFTDTGLTNDTTYYYRVKAQGTGYRDSAFSPTASGVPVSGADPDFLAWWDASDDGTVTTANGAVTQWNDKSGKGNHLTEATNTPTHSTANDTIAFTGVDTSSYNALSRVIEDMKFQQGDDFTIFIKGLKFTSGAAATPQAPLGYRAGELNNSGWGLNLAANGLALNFAQHDNTVQNFATWDNGGSGFKDGVARDIIFMNESGVLKIYNASNTNVGTNGNTSIGAITYTGVEFIMGVRDKSISRRPFIGDFQEVKIWSRALDSTERDTELGL